jgi:glycine/D-amino acid oxidase-like deaminating enzyme
MSMIARGFALALIVAAGNASSALAEQRGAELAPVIAWAGKSTQKAALEGRVAKALGLNNDGKPMQLVAVTTAYLDGARTLHLVGDGRVVFSQGKARVGQWYLTNASGALLRSLEWVPTSANPQPTAAAAVTPAFTEIKAFWKAQLGRPVR